jgi:hypothetical protein
MHGTAAATSHASSLYNGRSHALNGGTLRLRPLRLQVGYRSLCMLYLVLPDGLGTMRNKKAYIACCPKLVVTVSEVASLAELAISSLLKMPTLRSLILKVYITGGAACIRLIWQVNETLKSLTHYRVYSYVYIDSESLT